MEGLELAVAGSRRAQGALGEHGTQHRGAAAGTGGSALAGALVVARSDPGPSGQVLRAREGREVRPDLGEDRARGGAVDSRNGLEQPKGLVPRRQGGLDLAFEAFNTLAQRVVLVEELGEEPARVRVELEGQRLAQRVELGAHLGTERVEDRLALQPFDEAVEDAPGIDAEQVGEHAPHAHPAAVDDLLGAISHPAAVGDELAPVPGQGPDLTKRPRGHVAGPGQPELTHARQPLAVGDVGLASSQLLHMLGMDELRGNTRVFECLERGEPIHPGGFEHRRLDLVSAKQLTSRSSPSPKALNTPVCITGSPPSSGQRRTVAVTCIL